MSVGGQITRTPHERQQCSGQVVRQSRLALTQGDAAAATACAQQAQTALQGSGLLAWQLEAQVLAADAAAAAGAREQAAAAYRAVLAVATGAPVIPIR